MADGRQILDLLWRLRIRAENGGDAGWFYVYLHFEFQSRPDRFMAIRVGSYRFLLWEDLIRSKSLTPSGKLPPVLSASTAAVGRFVCYAAVMSRKPPDPAYHAPAGSDGPGYRLPSYGSPQRDPATPSRRPGSAARRAVRFPAVDDRLATPETGEEYLDGRRMMALPADAAHADPQCQLAYVVRACVAEGYVASTELLTRTDKGSDFATDVCVRKAGTDPKTGGRYLEELSFEVASTQTLARLKPRAKKLIARGVRRLFAVLVREGEVREWTEPGGWQVAGGEVLDRTLGKPLRVDAILDAAAADRLVAEALWAKREPFLVGIAQEQREEGRAAGLAEAILRALENHGVRLGSRERRALASCVDADRLRRWLDKALVVDTAKELVAELKK